MGLVNLLIIVCPDCTWHSAFSLFLERGLLSSQPVEYFRCFSFWDAALPLLTPLSCLLSSQCFFWNHSSVCVFIVHVFRLSTPPVLMYTWPIYLQVLEVMAQVLLDTLFNVVDFRNLAKLEEITSYCPKALEFLCDKILKIVSLSY